jgi:hypothetical protein
MALNNITEIMGEVLVRNNRTTTDTFITDATLKDWVQQAHRWAASYKKWPFTEGRNSTTFASLVSDETGYLRGSYPEGFKSDSIRMLTISGSVVQKTQFNQFQKLLEDRPEDDERVFTDFGRNYYINPRIDLSGTVTAWGQFLPYIDVTDETATTVFSGAEEEGNEAIVEKMTSFLKRREHLPDEAELHDQRASLKLEEIWKSIGDEQYGYQPTNSEGIWKRLDVVDGGYYDDSLKRDQF